MDDLFAVVGELVKRYGGDVPQDLLVDLAVAVLHLAAGRTEDAERVLVDISERAGE